MSVVKRKIFSIESFWSVVCFSFYKEMRSRCDETATKAVSIYANLCCLLARSNHLFLLKRKLIESCCFGPLTITVDWSLDLPLHRHWTRLIKLQRKVFAELLYVQVLLDKGTEKGSRGVKLHGNITGMLVFRVMRILYTWGMHNIGLLMFSNFSLLVQRTTTDLFLTLGPRICVKKCCGPMKTFHSLMEDTIVFKCKHRVQQCATFILWV